jgi:malonyl-CoA O-methyltransferase
MIVQSGGDPEKQQVRRAFSRAAAGYDGLATLQRQVAEQLLSHLGDPVLRPRRVLDLGTGTGYCVPRLSLRFPEARLIAVDLAEGMLVQLRQSRLMRREPWLVNGDAERLPLADASVDLILSNLALQWCPNLCQALGECARVLVPGGLLVFSTFGTATLGELREAWAGVDDHSHVNRFRSAAEVQSGLSAAGLMARRVERDLTIVTYPDVFALMNELRGLGASNRTANRPRSLTGKQRLRAMAGGYQAQYPAAGGGVRASFEVIAVVASRPA